MMTLKRKSTYHICKDFGVYPVFDKNTYDSLDIKTFENSLISFFEDENGNEYFALATLIKEYYSAYKITYDESKYTLTELIMNGKTEIPYKSDDPDAEDCTFFLYPGQMRLFRIDKK